MPKIETYTNGVLVDSRDEPDPPTPPNPADALQAAADSAAAAALEDVRALAPLLQAAADALRGA